LPVQQVNKVERHQPEDGEDARGLTIPLSLLGRDNEVIE